jgi:hypothetical protein
VLDVEATAAFLTVAIRKGAILQPWSRVREITVDQRGRAHSAIYYDREGALHEQTAKAIVVCCNGIGTPEFVRNLRRRESDIDHWGTLRAADQIWAEQKS